MDLQSVQSWIEAYVDAWHTNEPGRISALFAEGATYAYNPWDTPLRGREAIVADWLKEPDEPGSWEADYRPMLLKDQTAIITGVTRYDDGKAYSNLFVVEFDENGRCRAFTEWYMRQKTASPGF